MLAVRPAVFVQGVANCYRFGHLDLAARGD